MRRLPFRLSIFCLIAALGLSAVAAPPAPPVPPTKISADLVNTATSLVGVIIQYKAAPSTVELLQITGLSTTTPVSLNSINAVSATVSVSVLQVITSDSNVKYVTLDRPLHGRAVSSIARSAEYTVEPINAPAVWSQGYFGTGVGVAVIDSGVTPVPDLNKNT